MTSTSTTRSVLPVSPAPSPAVSVRDQRDRGFTLIELLVVVIIVGVLAAIAVPVFLRQREKAVKAALEHDLHNAAVILQTHVLEGGAMPAACTTGAACAAAGQIGPMLAGSPHDVKLSPGNRIGAYWFSPSNKTFRLCVEHAPNGVAQRFVTLDSWGAQALNDNHWSDTGACPTS